MFGEDEHHPWNRLFRALFIRSLPDGREFGNDELDPLLWPGQKEYLMQGRSYENALSALDEFERTNAQKLISDASASDPATRPLGAV